MAQDFSCHIFVHFSLLFTERMTYAIRGNRSWFNKNFDKVAIWRKFQEVYLYWNFLLFTDSPYYSKKIYTKYIMDKSSSTTRSMLNLFPQTSSTLSSTAPVSKTRKLTSLFSHSSSKKTAKKLMKQSNGYGSYSNLFRAKSFESLCSQSIQKQSRCSKWNLCEVVIGMYVYSLYTTNKLSAV